MKIIANFNSINFNDVIERPGVPFTLAVNCAATPRTK